MSDSIVVFGTGTLAELVEFYFRVDSDYHVEAFTADRDYIESDTHLGKPLVPFEEIESVYPPEENGMFVAIGYRDVNQLRAEKYRAAKEKGYKLVSYVCSESTVWTDDIGENCFIFEDQTIQPFVEIGDDVIAWSGNHIGHHAKIDDHVFITSHAVISGYVDIEPYSFIGVNATLRDEITIGEAGVIGAGATVIADTEPEGVYLGQPAEQYDKGSHEVDI